MKIAIFKDFCLFPPGMVFGSTVQRQMTLYQIDTGPLLTYTKHAEFSVWGMHGVLKTGHFPFNSRERKDNAFLMSMLFTKITICQSMY